MLGVEKCKDHYIDCVNVRSYDISNLCSNIKTMHHFVKLNNLNRELNCPFYVSNFKFKHKTIIKCYYILSYY